MSADEATTDGAAPAGSDVDERSGHRQVMRGGQRIIVVNSQPVVGRDERPSRKVRGLGTVAHHATDPVTGDGPRRRRGSTREALTALVVAALPVLVAAFAIARFLEDRTVVLVATGVLAVLWLIGLATAWRGLGPNGRDGRGGVFFGRAVGLVVGALGAVSMLIDVVPPLL